MVVMEVICTGDADEGRDCVCTFLSALTGELGEYDIEYIIVVFGVLKGGFRLLCGMVYVSGCYVAVNIYIYIYTGNGDMKLPHKGQFMLVQWDAVQRCKTHNQTSHVPIRHKHRLSIFIVLDRDRTGTIRSRHLLLIPETGSVQPECDALPLRPR